MVVSDAGGCALPVLHFGSPYPALLGNGGWAHVFEDDAERRAAFLLAAEALLVYVQGTLDTITRAPSYYRVQFEGLEFIISDFRLDP
jgi:hypothetical protein